MKNIANKSIAALSRIGLVASLFATSIFVTSCDKDQPVEELQLPAVAGEIGGPEEVIDGQSITLTVDQIANAATYRWFKDEVEVQNTDAKTLEVTEAGSYMVAGVNKKGQGAASEAHVVTLKTLAPPKSKPIIRGLTELITGQTIELSIVMIDGAEDYVWYKDGEEVKRGYHVTLEVTTGGTYTVRGVNGDGDGPLSNEHVVNEVTPTAVPADAGNITGDTSGSKGSVVSLSIGKIENAVTYKWYKDGVMVQNTASMTYDARESGAYKVAGVNNVGEGKASAEHTVTFADATLGVNKFSYDGQTFDFEQQNITVYYYSQYGEYNIVMYDTSARKKIEFDGLPTGETANIKDRPYYVAKYWEDTHLGETYPTQEDTSERQGNLKSGAFNLAVNADSDYKNMKLEATLVYDGGGRDIELKINYDGQINYILR
jgi:hypothetical protein